MTTFKDINEKDSEEKEKLIIELDRLKAMVERLNEQLVRAHGNHKVELKELNAQLAKAHFEHRAEFKSLIDARGSPQPPAQPKTSGSGEDLAEHPCTVEAECPVCLANLRTHFRVFQQDFAPVVSLLLASNHLNKSAFAPHSNRTSV